MTASTLSALIRELGGDHFTATLHDETWVVQLRVRNVAGERTYIVGEGATLEEAVETMARKVAA